MKGVERDSGKGSTCGSLSPSLSYGSPSTISISPNNTPIRIRSPNNSENTDNEPANKIIISEINSRPVRQKVFNYIEIF